jgi:hypothetical protein
MASPSHADSLAGSITARRLHRMQSRGIAQDGDAAFSLTRLDDRLSEALGRGYIRLVKPDWLIAQSVAGGFLVRPCQELRMMQPSPLLSPEDAVDVLRRANRSVGALTLGWLTPGHCDPCGEHLVCLQQALVVMPHIQAVFWDFASLPQHPRSEADEEAFACALSVMGDLYASAVGTTVLQMKQMPPRPPMFDGVVVLRNPKPRTQEGEIRALLSGHDVTQVNVPNGSVRFASHRSAIEAIKSGALASVCDAVELYYNERPYDKRGW